MDIKEVIRQSFKDNKIHQLQLDPNGLCNAGCWFCPVSIHGNPKRSMKPMPIDLLKRILDNILEEREKEDGLVSKNFGGFYTSHYNETLLYPYFEEFLKALRERRLCSMILTNGTPLVPQKVDLIKEYSDVINGLNINAPIWTNEDLFERRTGMRKGLFKNLIRNVGYAYEQLDYMVENKSFSVGLNGAINASFSDQGGWMTKGEKFPQDYDLENELDEQYNEVKRLFPKLQAFKNPSLIDRAGLLDEVMTNKDAIHQHLKKNDETRKVIGCGNGIEVGGRPVGWLHINALGEAFLCCNDYDMEITVGDLSTQKLSDFWGKEEHIEKIAHSYATICQNCAQARFE